MGVNTIAFVTAKKEVMFDLMPKLIKDLNKWQRVLLDEHWKGNYDSRLQFLLDTDFKDWSNGIGEVRSYNFGSFTIPFKVNGEQRDLFITHNCSNDYSDTYKGDKIIFSLGNWGMSKEIMMVVAESVKDFGRVFYVGNDCSEDLKELDFKAEILN